MFQGGMKAVMWTDVFQIFVMFAGMLAVVIRGLIEMGGFSNVWAAAERGRRIEFLKYSAALVEQQSLTEIARQL